ncbi:MAG TPA: VWA domain-containing protein [Desulfosporosinus sp.]|nr:VWA domain-containing protein [Desulfosporosinus sp.]
MAMEKKKAKMILGLVGAALIVFGAVYLGISFTKNLGKSATQINSETAAKSLEKITKDITVTKVEPKKGQVDLGTADLKNSLPDISKYPAQVDNSTPNYIEIFSSTEKAGSGTDGWLTEVAKAFNNSAVTIDGIPVSVRIRGIASGTGADYITSGKYVPDAFTPSNELWGEMLKSQGAKAVLVKNRLAGNVAGILISKAKNDELVKKYGSINIKTVTDAVSANELAMGYTNPLASSTGLNFLVTSLSTFDSSNLLSDKAVKGFESFQSNIPFVAYTTLQMRDSAKSGVLDGFILEYQTYANSPDIKSDYAFTPFGVRHDSPVYAIGDLTTEKTKILNSFIDFSQQDKYQKLATDYGFNALNDYKSESAAVSGDVIGQALKLWKDKKNGSKNICAVFVADVSGSMNGEPINKLKQSLLQGEKYIGKENSVGLVSYSDNVNINLPVGKFDLNQRSLFAGAVNSLEANGNTATFDGIAVAMQMIQEEMVKNPDLKPMIFVLSDGATNRGHSLDEIKGIVEAKKIPIYTIGYNADIAALQSISSINEAASINADTDDVIYKLGNLFNAQM